MSDPRGSDAEHDQAVANLVRTLGLALCWLGLLGIVAAAIEFVVAIVRDDALHLVGFFFAGLVCLIVGWALLSRQKSRAAHAVSIDCGQCGMINDSTSSSCRSCGAPL